MSGVLPLSVVVVAREEACNLPRCLGSVGGWTAERIVALNGADDGSAAIARQSGAAVYELEWKGFRDTKNSAVQFASQPWVLCLDADEEVSPELRRSIHAFLSGPKAERHAGARFPRKVWFIDRWIRHGDWYPDYSLRLIRRGQCRWQGGRHVHERIECDGPVATLKGDLHHYSFPNVSAQVAKINPFADLFVREQTEQGRRFSLIDAVFRPGWRFFRGYVLKGGFLDGYPGFYIAWASAFASLVRYTRLFELEHRPRAGARR
jgi:glycosyltransferase involved in cell wall biosynthesis